MFGGIRAASPLAIRWLDTSTVQALLLATIAAIYIGFAVADGRSRIIAVKSSIAGAFVLLAAVGVTGTPWLLVLVDTIRGASKSAGPSTVRFDDGSSAAPVVVVWTGTLD